MMSLNLIQIKDAITKIHVNEDTIIYWDTIEQQVSQPGISLNRVTTCGKTCNMVN